MGDDELDFVRSRSDLNGKAIDAALTKARSSNQPTPSPGPRHLGISGSESLRSLLQSVKSEAERKAIAMALERTGWNRKAAARLLKVSYRTVLYKIEEYHLIPADSYRFPRRDPAD